MYDFWQNQDVFVNISDNEGRPISNIEAMINGAVPVVTDTYGSIADVSDNINGLDVPIGDYKTMADKISFLNDNRSEIAGLGIAAREYMIKKNDINFYKNQWQKL
jgi:glycosyltransferase involved in cell wall biosynthesis